MRSDLQQRAATRLVLVARLYRREADRALVALGLSDATAIPVVTIDRLGDGVRQNRLAAEIGVEGPSLVRLLDQLVEAGLVERREDAFDRRAKTVHLTEAGRAQSRRAQAALDAFRDRVFAKVSDPELQACVNAFGVLEAALSGSDGGS